MVIINKIINYSETITKLLGQKKIKPKILHQEMEVFRVIHIIILILQKSMMKKQAKKIKKKYCLKPLYIITN